jgi:DNA-binding response OmpR family regulator
VLDSVSLHFNGKNKSKRAFLICLLNIRFRVLDKLQNAGWDMKTILWVEDDKNLQLLYKLEMESLGYRVVFCTDGMQAFDILSEVLPDVVVTDIAMPKGDGIEMIGRILSNHDSVPIIINTAHHGYRDMTLCWAADAYVVKSSDLSELKGKIQMSLAGSQGVDATPIDCS